MLGFPRQGSVGSRCLSRAGHTALHQCNSGLSHFSSGMVHSLEPALVFSSFLQKLSPYTTTKQKSKQLSAGLAPWAESDKLQSKSEGQDGIKAVLIYVFSDCCGNNFWEFRASSYCIAGSLHLLLRCCAIDNLRVDVSDATVPLQHLHSDFSRKKCDFFLRCVNELSVVSLNKADLI